MKIPFMYKSQKPSKLIDKRMVKDNLSIQRMSKGVEGQFKRVSNPQIASNELRKRLATLRKK